MKWSMSRSAKALAIAGLLAGAALPAKAETLYRSVSVDTSEIAARYNPVLAQNIRAMLQADLSRSFADRMTSARGAPQLVVRITGIQQAALPEGDGLRYGGGGGGSNDYMNGEALIVANGRVLASHPMLSALDSNYAGSWYQRDADRKRLAALSWQYAAWLRREMASY